MIDLPAGRRSATTLMKLPTAAPRKKDKANHIFWLLSTGGGREDLQSISLFQVGMLKIT